MSSQTRIPYGAVACTNPALCAAQWHYPSTNPLCRRPATMTARGDIAVPLAPRVAELKEGEKIDISDDSGLFDAYVTRQQGALVSVATFKASASLKSEESLPRLRVDPSNQEDFDAAYRPFVANRIRKAYGGDLVGSLLDDELKVLFENEVASTDPHEIRQEILGKNSRFVEDAGIGQEERPALAANLASQILDFEFEVEEGVGQYLQTAMLLDEDDLYDEESQLHHVHHEDGVSQLGEGMKEKIENDFREFLGSNYHLFEEAQQIRKKNLEDGTGYYSEPYGIGDFAHDYALTRNGHGTGFWDRELGEVGDALTTAAAEERGEMDLERGDDGKIYVV